MARLAYESSSEEDEFPDVKTLVQRATKRSLEKDGGKGNATVRKDSERPTSASTDPGKATTVRRRRLGKLSDNQLLRPWTPNQSDNKSASTAYLNPKAVKPRIQLRAKKEISAVQINPIHSEGGQEIKDSDDDENEETFIEEATMDDDSDFNETLDFYSAEEDNVFDKMSPTKLPAETLQTQPAVSQPKAKVPLKRMELPSTKSTSSRTKSSSVVVSSKLEDDMADLLDQMDINAINVPQDRPARKAPTDWPKTPPRSTTPPKARPTGLVSPTKKLAQIPSTPHHPNSDLFWSREFVDDWNDEHSPKKQLFPDAKRSPVKPASSPKKKADTSKAAAERQTKKAFDQAKHDMAAKFLQELDTAITQGRVAELSASTGGVKLVWSKTLNTTAGRAIWKRTTSRSKNPDGTTVIVKEEHHASIELAEKVIDSEDRLLNTLAHEFCHLANFMVSGVTGNPHGKEFKVWASRCSRAFGPRGIEVTTKHSYDIDFKYVWECASCAAEYKRHSRSIDPKRHRCGDAGCKGVLKQTKPTPRATAGKASEYQVFMKEQMKVLKEKNPKSPQKDIMKLVANRWASRQEVDKHGGGSGKKEDRVVAAVATTLIDLTLDDDA